MTFGSGLWNTKARNSLLGLFQGNLLAAGKLFVCVTVPVWMHRLRRIVMTGNKTWVIVHALTCWLFNWGMFKGAFLITHYVFWKWMLHLKCLLGHGGTSHMIWLKVLIQTYFKVYSMCVQLYSVPWISSKYSAGSYELQLISSLALIADGCVTCAHSQNDGGS